MKVTRDTLPWTSPIIIRVVSVVMNKGKSNDKCVKLEQIK